MISEAVARISHSASAAAADPSILARAAPSAGLDVPFEYASPVFSAHPAPERRLVALATNRCEKCGPIRISFRPFASAKETHRDRENFSGTAAVHVDFRRVGAIARAAET
jgi:hypothetical protein